MNDADAISPVACDPRAFSAAEWRAHIALSVDVILRWPTRREELPGGYAFHYRRDEEVFLALARWTGEESRCCPWLNYALEMTPDRNGAGVTLRLTAPTEDGKAALTTGLELLENTQEGRLLGDLADPARAQSLFSLIHQTTRRCGC